MPRSVFAVLVTSVLFAGLSAVTAAQTGGGSLSGYVKDDQGGVLPGVSVTAMSPALIQPVSATTDGQGYYRLINLPPGTYVVTAELSGFAAYRQQDILLRAGANYTVDISLKIGAISESVTVSGQSPMLETALPSNVLNISGEFQRDMPIQARRNWSDFLELTPGVHSRPFDDGSGRMVYFGHATEHFAHVLQLEGMIASNYYDAQVTYVGMGADMVEDTQVKTGGTDASSPAGTGLVINVMTKSGGNRFKGSGALEYQPLSWNGNNVPQTGNFSGTPTTSQVHQLDGSVGGPIRPDNIWFFSALRYASLENGISRTGNNVQNLHAFFPNLALFNNTSKSWLPFAKGTARLSDRHQLAVVYQHDRLRATGDREDYFSPVNVYSTGGSLYGAKVTSVWGNKVTTTFLASYNNKQGSDASTYEGLIQTGPYVQYHRATTINAPKVIGTGILAQGGNLNLGNVNGAGIILQPASLTDLRGDLTYFKEGWRGSHQISTGFLLEPSSHYDEETQYLNNGFILEERVQVDPTNPAAGTVPFHRTYVTPTDIRARQARDQDIGVYVQDQWRPTPRLTASLGIRYDHAKRVDQIFNFTRENAGTWQPRIGFSYLVTSDAKNVLRGSYSRLAEQMMGRDAVTTFGAASKVGQTDQYSLDGFKTIYNTITTPAQPATLASYQFDPNVHQPYIDEFILGFRKQFSGQLGIDIAGIQRTYKDTYARIDVNGFYPSGPNQPFLGFGKIDPNQGIIFQQTNNTWSQLSYFAIEMTATKNLSHHFQALAGINRQWQHYNGTWNPTDNARFLQPAAFPSDTLLYQPRGNNEDTSLPLTTGTSALTYGPTWQKYRLNFGGSYQAPYGVIVAASYTIEAGPWSGPIVDLIGDPTPYGPPTFTLANGTKVQNPLSTRLRFVYPTRGDGQVQAPAVKTLGLKIGKTFKLVWTSEIEVAASIFNVLNGGDFTQYNYNGADEVFNTANFLQMRNQQPARAAQLTAVFRF